MAPVETESGLWDRTQWEAPARSRVDLLFPRIIHFIWIPSLDRVPPECAENPRRWEALNPGWRVMLWNEERVVNCMKEFVPDLIKTYRSLGPAIKRADFARLVVLLRHGGLYVDYDMVPWRALDCLFSEPVVLAHKSHHSSSVPRFVTRAPVDWSRCEMVLSREYRRIDRFTSVANGALFSVPENPVLGEFLYAQAPKTGERVLDYLGPHALTRHLRTRIDMDRAAILPPYYFLWEDRAFRHEAPGWVVCKHAGKSNWINTWNKEDPFDVR